MKLMRRLAEGDELPRGWGYCWRNYHDWSTVIAPLGLNLLISAARFCWSWVAFIAPRWLNDNRPTK